MKLIKGEKKSCPHCDDPKKMRGIAALTSCPYPENHMIDARGAVLTIESLERALFKMKYGKVARIVPKEKKGL